MNAPVQQINMGGSLRFQPIAEREVLYISPDGRSRTIRLLIGLPKPTSHGDWECPVAAEGLYDNLSPMVGVDSWQALNLAIGLLEQLLRAEVHRGAILKWVDNGAVSIDTLFSRQAPA